MRGQRGGSHNARAARQRGGLSRSRGGWTAAPTEQELAHFDTDMELHTMAKNEMTRISADELVARQGLTVHTFAGDRGEVQRRERLARVYAETGTRPIEETADPGPRAVYVRNDWDRAARTVADDLQSEQ